MGRAHHRTHRRNAARLGDRLRRRLAELELTVAECARRSGFSRVAVIRWCDGVTMPTLDSVIRLAKALGCSVEDLVGS